MSFKITKNSGNMLYHLIFPNAFDGFFYIPRECATSTWSALDSLPTANRAAEPFRLSWETLGNGDRPPALHLSSVLPQKKVIKNGHLLFVSWYKFSYLWWLQTMILIC